MNNTFLVVFTALVSGLVATLITIFWQKYERIKIEKNNIFKILMSKRYEISCQESVDALNMVEVIFYSSKKVRNAWVEFKVATDLPNHPNGPQNITDKYLKLLETMAEDLGYKDIKWDNIKNSYFPNGLSEQLNDEKLLRKLQINNALMQNKENKDEELLSQI